VSAGELPRMIVMGPVYGSRKTKKALVPHVHLQEKGMKIARTLGKRLAM